MMGVELMACSRSCCSVLTVTLVTVLLTSCHLSTCTHRASTSTSTASRPPPPPGDSVTRHHHHQQQQQEEDADDDGALSVSVDPEFSVMRRGRPVHVNCTATSLTATQPPYISFFVRISALYYTIRYEMLF